MLLFPETHQVLFTVSYASDCRVFSFPPYVSSSIRLKHWLSCANDKAYLIMLKILSHIVTVSLLALGPEEIPEETKPIQKKRRRLAFAGKVGAWEVIRDFDFLAIFSIRHHGVAINSIHLVITTMAGTRLDRGFCAEFHCVVLQQGPGTVVVAALEKVVIDVGVEVVDHLLGDIIHGSIVTRSRRAVVDHWDTTDGASGSGVHSSDVHLVHGGTRGSATLTLCLSSMKSVGTRVFLQRASTVSRRGSSPQGKTRSAWQS